LSLLMRLSNSYHRILSSAIDCFKISIPQLLVFSNLRTFIFYFFLFIFIFLFLATDIIGS
jgi:hypothetical protein